RHMRHKCGPPTLHRERHFIAKLAIVKRNSSNGLHLMTTFGAPTMDDLHLLAHQSTISILRDRGNQFRPSDSKRNSLIGPCLIDQAQRRDDLIILHDDQEIIWRKSGMVAAQQVKHPGV